MSVSPDVCIKCVCVWGGICSLVTVCDVVVTLRVHMLLLLPPSHHRQHQRQIQTVCSETLG